MEFSKLLLAVNYIIFALLVISSYFYEGVADIAVAWIAVLAIGTGFYFWKSKAENRMKIPIYMLLKLPKSMRDDVDMTEIIKSILGD